MSSCNSILISKVGMKPLDKTIEVDFSVLTNLENCLRINTRNFLPEFIEGYPSFNSIRIPDDKFGCLTDCKNSGTLMLAGDGSVGARFIIRADATEFPTGVITFYAYFPEVGTHTVTTSISDVTDQLQNNADVYEKQVTVLTPGFHPIVVDLNELPNGGSAWVPSELGVTIGLSVDAAVAGFSSIFIYNSIEDFEVNDVVKVGCIDEFSGEFTLDARDASCFGAGYDPASIAIERTITGRSVTSNYWKLNPLTKKGEASIGWLPRTMEQTVNNTMVINGVTYGYVQLADLHQEECGFLLASLSHECMTDGILRRVHSPIAVEIAEMQFILLDAVVNPDHEGVLLFHESLVGSEVLISYPQQVDAEHFVGNAADLDARRVRMSIVKEQTDGVRQHYVYNNVLVTSFPDALSDEETTFDFTISVQRDRNGNFYDMFRVAN